MSTMRKQFKLLYMNYSILINLYLLLIKFQKTICTSRNRTVARAIVLIKHRKDESYLKKSS